MKKLVLLLGMVLICSVVQAADKVVVIPLGGSSNKISNNTSPCNSSTAGVIRWTGLDQFLKGVTA